MSKNFEDGSYWDRFGNQLLKPEDRPTPREAADFIISLFVRLEKAGKEITDARLEAKCAHQEFKTFALEVANLAEKRRTIGPNS